MSIGDVGNECKVSRSLNSKGELSLVACTGTGYSAGKNLSSLGEILAETKGILVIDVIDFICTESANFLSSLVATEGSSCAVTLLARLSLLSGLVYFFNLGSGLLSVNNLFVIQCDLPPFSF